MERLSDRWMFYCGLLAGMGVGVDDLKHIQDLIDAEEQGFLLRLDSKDKLIEVLATKLLHSEFGNCYMCTNPMKNITLDGVNNGCDGGCNTSEEFTVDDFLKKIVEEMQRKEEAEQKFAEMRKE